MLNAILNCCIRSFYLGVMAEETNGWSARTDCLAWAVAWAGHKSTGGRVWVWVDGTWNINWWPDSTSYHPKLLYAVMTRQSSSSEILMPETSWSRWIGWSSWNVEGHAWRFGLTQQNLSSSANIIKEMETCRDYLKHIRNETNDLKKVSTNVQWEIKELRWIREQNSWRLTITL